MHDDLQDRIAFEAARLIDSGAVADEHQAIDTAVRSLKVEHIRNLPTLGAVRRHLQGMAMQSLGLEGYREAVARKLEAIEQLMTLLEEQENLGTVQLCGRAARGLVDGPAPVYLRLITTAGDAEIAQALIRAEYGEPEFTTLRGPFGVFDQLRVSDDEFDAVITRIPTAVRLPPGRNLRTGEEIVLASLADVRAKLLDKR